MRHKMFKSKFIDLYNLVMESLIGGIKPNSEEKSEFNVEVSNFFNKLIDILKSDSEINFNENSELIELAEKENKKIIKCPNRIRSIIMNNNNVFLTKHITNLLNESDILKDYDFKISDVSNKKEDYSNIKTSTDDIEFVKKGDSSAGGYDIPIIIQSNDDPEDFYTFTLRLIAKPNTGKIGQRDGNVSITVCEFIPVMLWNTNASTSIDVESIVDMIKTFDIKDASITGKQINEGTSSYKKLVQFKDYFNNKYENDSEKNIITNKIYGAISIYSFLKEKYGNAYKGICIWTDITSLKPAGLEDSPADIMIEKSSSSNDWLQISLKSGGEKEEDPPLANPTIKSFFQFINFNGGNYDVKKDIFDDVIKKAETENKWFTKDEIAKLRSYENSQKLLVNYINNNLEDKFKNGGEGTLRQYIIDKLYDIIIKEFSNDYQKLINYILQIKDSKNFLILKAIEKKGSTPEIVDLNVVIDNELEIKKTNTSIIFSNFMINGVYKKIEMAVRTKGHGLHAYFSYDLVVKLLNDKKK